MDLPWQPLRFLEHPTSEGYPHTNPWPPEEKQNTCIHPALLDWQIFSTMPDDPLHWLASYAERLNGPFDGAVEIEDILAHFKIRHNLKIQAQDSSDRKSGGHLISSERQSYSIIITRPMQVHATVGSDDYTARERFTLAHELAHVLLIQNFGFNPQKGPEYYQCERLCDAFAGALLVPHRWVNDVRVNSAAQLLAYLGSLAARLRVSRAVVAVEMVKFRTGIGFFRGRQQKNAARKSVIAIQWSAVSIKDLSLHPHAHLRSDHSIGQVLLSESHVFNRSQIREVALSQHLALAAFKPNNTDVVVALFEKTTD